MIDNELIARFMGVKEEQGFYDSYGKDDPYWFTSNKIYRTYSRSLPDLSFDDFVENSRYHIEWDWLMPVVEKIESLGYLTSIYALDIDGNKRRHDVLLNDFSGDQIKKCYGYSYNSKIEAVYKAVVEFIKWYNELTIKP